MREVDGIPLYAIVLAPLVAGIGNLTLEGEIEPLGSLVIYVQCTRITLEGSIGCDARSIVVAEGGEVAESLRTPRGREGEVIEATRTPRSSLRQSVRVVRLLTKTSLDSANTLSVRVAA